MSDDTWRREFAQLMVDNPAVRELIELATVSAIVDTMLALLPWFGLADRLDEILTNLDPTQVAQRATAEIVAEAEL